MGMTPSVSVLGRRKYRLLQNPSFYHAEHSSEQNQSRTADYKKEPKLRMVVGCYG
jgi:hypothetical protein